MSNAMKTLTNGILKENPTFALGSRYVPYAGYYHQCR